MANICADRGTLPATVAPANVRGIVFDYGGTLDTRGDHWSHIIRQGWEREGLTFTEEQFRDSYVHAERALAAERIILPGDDFYALMLKKARIELSRFAAITGRTKPFAESVAAGIAEYCNSYAAACIRKAEPVLKALSQHFPLVLVSNFYGNVDEVLRSFGIRGYFRGIIESAVVGVRKPSSSIFRLGCVALGLETGNVLVVGDSLRKDIEPARSIGCQTAWIKGRGWTADEDAASDPALIPSLQTLLTLAK